MKIGQRKMGVAGFTLLEILAVCVVISILAVLLVPQMERMIEAANRASCVVNQRSVHGVLGSYAADNRNCFPPGIAAGITWVGPVAPYLSTTPNALNGRKSGITYCPSTKMAGEGIYKRDRGTWRTDYNVNGNVMSATEAANTLASTPVKLVLVYDGGGAARGSAADAKESLRHSGHFNVTFVDGHCELLTTFDDHKDYWKK